MTGDTERLGLILTGGGARSAYQVGVLKAIAEILPSGTALPFPVITGTSAGAVSATVLASRAGDFRGAVRGLEDVWANFRVHQVFRADMVSVLRAGLHWLLAFISSGLLLPPPRSLFDNSPLRELISRTVPFRGVRRSIQLGRLHALGICATGFTSGRPVCFFQGTPDIATWDHTVSSSRRVSALDLEHVMASLSIPFLFPAVRLGNEYFGDGAMRQATPLSPAINLGASRLLVIGVRSRPAEGAFGVIGTARPPSTGQLFGYMLDTLFMDQIYADLEQLERLNELVGSAPAPFAGLRGIRAMLLAPSRDPREIAAHHTAQLPRGLRVLLRTLGTRNPAASSLASYLMFEAPYTRELIDLGFADAMARRAELLDFLRPAGALPAAVAVPSRELVASARREGGTGEGEALPPGVRTAES
jgi:NTE family protein